MLNKELLLSLTPTSDEGIFLITVVYWEEYRESYEGIDISAGKGNITALGEPIVKGTSGEAFKIGGIRLYHKATITALGFMETHFPNMSDTTVYAHIKYSDNSIETLEYYFDLNEKVYSTWDPSAQEGSKLGGEIGNTIRV